MDIENGAIRYSSDGYVKGFYLGHSCDEWVIGDIEKAKKFAADLLKTIAEVESATRPTTVTEEER